MIKLCQKFLGKPPPPSVSLLADILDIFRGKDFSIRPLHIAFQQLSVFSEQHDPADEVFHHFCVSSLLQNRCKILIGAQRRLEIPINAADLISTLEDALSF